MEQAARGARISLPPADYRFTTFVTMPLRAAPWAFLGKVILTLGSALTPSLQALATAVFVDTALAVFAGTSPYGAVFRPILYIVALLAFEYLHRPVLTFCGEVLMLRLQVAVRGALLSKRARLSYRHLENNDSWDLVARTCKESAERVAGGLNNLLQAGTMVIGIVSLLTILFVQVWWAALAVIALFVPLFLMAMRGGKSNYEANQEAEKIRRRADYLHKVLAGRDSAEERGLFGYTGHLNELWLRQYDEARRNEQRVNLRNFIRIKGTGLVTVLISSSIALVLLFALRDGGISPGMFMGLVTAVFGVINMFSWMLPWTMSELAKNNAWLKDFSAFSKLSEQEGALDAARELPDFVLRSIAFKDVSFRYPDTERYILKDFSLRLEAGRHYAFVGVNGAGKTTVTKLLTGLYDNFEGEILLNGKSIREFPQAALKALFSVVYQDFAKYQIPLRDNIALGKDTGDGAVLAAAERIGLGDMLKELPQGLSTPLGKLLPEGTEPSGGQWQRLAIARALVGGAQLRILDEPTAALDPVAESQVYSLFGQISAGLSTVFITHRLGAARLADEIVVIDEGRVAELGSHEALMAAGGLYARMFESQKGWYQ